MDTPPRTPTNDQNSNGKCLRDRMVEAEETNDAIFGGHTYLPADRIAGFLTEENIIRELKSSNLPLKDLIDYIMTKARKVFLILVSMEAVQDIVPLQAGNFGDEALPVNKKPKGTLIYSYNKDDNTLQSEHLQCFGALGSRAEYFTTAQWKFLAPTFGDGTFRRELNQARPLPFVSIGENSCKKGNYSYVYKVAIQEAHYDRQVFHQPLVAVKKFHPDTDAHFERELQILETIKQLNHPHLNQVLAAFKSGANQYFIFPWAEGGTFSAGHG